ncbi:putative clathrin assembly protein [Hibiscus syriacus]|uniref:Clathrin assembly protein n=1 Tax=Hibiscus syriacus TaxID=106335 RepID=A0A6A3BCV8_HIBSY|nr:putative clathrin assembly protein [Hibiscus syriacus]
MGTFKSLRQAYDALKDSTKVGLAKDLDVAIVKATSHSESPPKERHVRSKVAIKVLIVIHRTLREGDPTFREELMSCSHRAHILHISNFKDDSSPLAWDCSAWVRTYALFLEERLECFRILKYDIETEGLIKSSPTTKSHSRTRVSGSNELIEQLPVLQQLLFRLIGCQPEGAACTNYLVQYALALFFDMPKHEAIKALNIYKEADNLAEFYEYCKALDLARNFQFPTLRQPPPSFLATMEEISITSTPEQEEVVEEKEKEIALADEEETQLKEEPKEIEQLVPVDDSTGDLLGLNEINPRALELEESNALALAILPAGNVSTPNRGLSEIGGTGWELALVTAPSNHTTPPRESKLAGGFDKLLLDSLYEDDAARKHIRLKNAGYRYEDMKVEQNLFQHDPFTMSNNIAPPTNVQMALLAQQQQQMMLMPYQHTTSSNPFGDPFFNLPSTSTSQSANHTLL